MFNYILCLYYSSSMLSCPATAPSERQRTGGAGAAGDAREAETQARQGPHAHLGTNTHLFYVCLLNGGSHKILVAFLR